MFALLPDILSRNLVFEGNLERNTQSHVVPTDAAVSERHKQEQLALDVSRCTVAQFGHSCGKPK